MTVKIKKLTDRQVRVSTPSYSKVHDFKNTFQLSEFVRKAEASARRSDDRLVLVGF